MTKKIAKKKATKAVSTKQAEAALRAKTVQEWRTAMAEAARHRSTAIEHVAKMHNCAARAYSLARQVKDTGRKANANAVLSKAKRANKLLRS